MISYIRIFVVSISLAILMTLAANVSFADNHEATTDGVGVVFDAQARSVGTFTDDTDSDFALGNVRLGTSFTKSVFDGRVSVQYDGTDLNLLDASVSLPLLDSKVTAKVGRFIVPADKAVMGDVYAWTEWQGATVISKWSSVDGYGRRDGAAVSGNYGIEGVNIAYNAGVFSGENGNALFAARFDFEPVSVDDLTFGGVVQAQDGFLGLGIDVEYSKALFGVGTLSVDGVFNIFNLDDASYTPNVGLNAGSGFSVGTSFLVNKTFPVASVKIQPEPFFRYQRFEYSDGFDGSRTRVDVGANLLLAGFDQTKLTVNYFRNEDRFDDADNGVLLGAQFAF